MREKNNELSLKDLQEREFGLLESFTHFCESNDLVYYLAYGTLLGAVRHQGFIPWDDDVDVWMPRPSFEKFCSLYPRGDFVDPFIVTPDDDDSLWLVAKFMDRSTLFEEEAIGSQEAYGVYIDIFPLDGLAGDELPLSRMRSISRLTHMYTYSHCLDRSWIDPSLKGKARRALGALGRMKPREWYIREMRRLMMRDSFEDADYAIAYASPYPLTREAGPVEDFLGDRTLPFEGREFRVPQNYEAVLERIYGSNWRTPIHNASDGHGKAYWRDDPKNNQNDAIAQKKGE